MKHHVRTLACGAALLAIACGGKQTMASKSAAAYDEAQKKGTPIAAGEHGGHSVPHAAEDDAAGDAAAPERDHGATAGMDHSKMDHAKMDHSQMDHSKMTAAEHAQMAGMDHSKMDHSKMDHSKMPGMQHAASGAAGHHMAAMDHAETPGMKHDTAGAAGHDMASMNHSMPGMQHRAAPTPPLAIAPPSSNAAISQTQPAATLRADEFDAPAPSAVGEAAKASAAPPPAKHHDHGDGDES